MSIYQPYTYLIGWTKYNKWYYGAEYKNSYRGIANPKNLWNTYYTSSNYVRRFREQYGEPDVIEIRKIFNSSEECLKWENKVLRRLLVETDDKWLNQTTKYFRHTSGWKHSFEDKNNISIKTKIWRESLDKNTSDRLNSNLIKDARWNKGKKGVYSQDTLKAMSKARIDKKYKWYTNGVDSICIPLENNIPDGFYKGRTLKSKG